MPRYIDAEKIPYSFDVVPNADPRKSYFKATADKRDIDKMPTISPDEVRGVGEWIEDRMDYRCSDCGETVKDEIFYMFYPYRLPKFCPNCGARMTRAEAEKAMEVHDYDNR